MTLSNDVPASPVLAHSWVPYLPKIPLYVMVLFGGSCANSPRRGLTCFVGAALGCVAGLALLPTTSSAVNAPVRRQQTSNGDYEIGLRTPA